MVRVRRRQTVALVVVAGAIFALLSPVGPAAAASSPTDTKSAPAASTPLGQTIRIEITATGTVTTSTGNAKGEFVVDPAASGSIAIASLDDTEQQFRAAVKAGGAGWSVTRTAGSVVLTAALPSTSTIPTPTAPATVITASPLERVSARLDPCIAALTCTFDWINALSIPSRVVWFDGLLARVDQFAPGASRWFANIRGVLALATEKRFDTVAWFRIVDAAILQGIQDGLRWRISPTDAPTGNLGQGAWRDFFVGLSTAMVGRTDVSQLTETTQTALSVRWGVAEQLATNSGIQITETTRQYLPVNTAGIGIHFSLIDVGNLYRSTLARGGSAGLNRIDWICHATITDPNGIFALLARGPVGGLDAAGICPNPRALFRLDAGSSITSLGRWAYDKATLQPLVVLLALAVFPDLLGHDLTGPWALAVADPWSPLP